MVSLTLYVICRQSTLYLVIFVMSWYFTFLITFTLQNIKKAEIYISGIVCYIHVRTFLNQQEWLMQIKQVNPPPPSIFTNFVTQTRRTGIYSNYFIFILGWCLYNQTICSLLKKELLYTCILCWNYELFMTISTTCTSSLSSTVSHTHIKICLFISLFLTWV